VQAVRMSSPETCRPRRRFSCDARQQPRLHPTQQRLPSAARAVASAGNRPRAHDRAPRRTRRQAGRRSGALGSRFCSTVVPSPCGVTASSRCVSCDMCVGALTDGRPHPSDHAARIFWFEQLGVKGAKPSARDRRLGLVKVVTGVV
jgi:hypothetical protein